MILETNTDTGTDLESSTEAVPSEKETSGRPKPLVRLSPAECALVSGGAFATDSPLY